MQTCGRSLFLIGFLLATGCGVSASHKKGVGVWYFPSVNRAVVDANVSWYYTWEPHTMRISPPPGVEFVPMIWSEKHVKSKDLELAKQSGSVLLGFNEPDHP